jgi:hypothetical protein
MIKKIKNKWIQQGRDEMLSQVIEKFAEMHDQYYGEGDFDASNLVIDLVAFLQNDYEGISDTKWNYKQKS